MFEPLLSWISYHCLDFASQYSLLYLILGLTFKIILCYLYHCNVHLRFLRVNLWHVVTHSSVYLEHCSGSVGIIYYTFPLHAICNTITIFFLLSCGQNFCDPFLVHPHLKRPTLPLFISEGGACIVVTMQHNY